MVYLKPYFCYLYSFGFEYHIVVYLFSAEEAGNYLETYKMYENKSADLIKEKQDDDNYSQVRPFY